MPENQQGRVVYVCPVCGEHERSELGPPRWIHTYGDEGEPLVQHWHKKAEGVERTGYVTAVPTRVYTKEEIKEKLLSSAAVIAVDGVLADAHKKRSTPQRAARVARECSEAALTAAFPHPDQHHLEDGGVTDG
jgi:hypothetical protein